MEEEATKRNGNILVHRKIEYLLKMKQKKTKIEWMERRSKTINKKFCMNS
jgi:hypothetical protein